MRLVSRFIALMGAILVITSNSQPAFANHRSPETFPVSQAPGSSVVFEHLTIEEGLSQNAGLALLQDHQGYIWIGTQDGLDRYDGYSFTIFKHDPDEPNSISYNSVISLHEDQKNNLWIGTWGGGLNRFDPQTRVFTRYAPDPADSNSLSDLTISALAEDQSGNLWIGSTGGLDLLNPESGLITHFRHDPDNPASLSSDAIGALFVDKQGNLWVGTGAYGVSGAGLNLLDGSSHEVRRVPLACSSAENISSILQDQHGYLWIGHGGYGLTGGGLTRYDPATQDCIHYDNNPREPNFGAANIIKMILDRDGWLWITTYESGLFRMEVDAPGEFYSYHNVPGDLSSMSSDNGYALLQDHSGVLWVGTLNSGVNKLKPRTLQFGLYRNNPADPASLGSDKVGTFAEDKNGNLWVGTWGAGLDQFNPYTGRFTHYRHADDEPASLADDTVMVLAADAAGGLWVGTLGAGLDYFDVHKGTFTHHRHDPANPASLANDNVTSLRLDGQGNLWVGTLDGLDCFDPASGEFIHYPASPENPDALSHPAVVSLFVDQDNVLWLGTWGGGLNRLDLKDPASFQPESARFTHYRSDPANPDSLSDDSIWVIHQSKQDGVLWLGTQGGLDRFDLQTGSFKNYTEKDGLRNATILGVLEDPEGDLWIATNNGLAKFTPSTETFRIFDHADGLQSNEFDSNAYFETSTGKFLFGGIHGFNIFDPLEIQPNPIPPEIVVTDFKIYNESVQADLSGAQAIVLKPKQDFIAFEFAALDYYAPQKNQYAYMLEGLDKDWIEAGTRRYASYTNLRGGEYIFRVKGTNSDGIWNEAGVAIPVTVTPPFWQTWWFAAIGVVLLAGTVAFGFQWRVRAVKEDAHRLETLVTQRTAELSAANDQLEVEIQQRRQAEEALSKRAAEELEQSEARFRTMFETSAVGIGIMSLDRKVVEANPALCQMYGYTCEELVGQTSALVTHPDDLSRSTQYMQGLLDGEFNHYTDERRYVRKNGEVFWAQITMSMVKDAQGKPAYIVGMLTDITEEKRMLEDLRRSQARFQAVFENAAVGIALMSLDRRALEVNPVTEKIIGFSAEELKSVDPRSLALPEDLSVDDDLFPEMIAGKRNSYIMERRYRRKNGEIFWARINYSLVRDLDGKPEYLVGMIEDIDDQKRASERLAAQEAEHRRILERRIAERTQELNKANELLQQKATQEAVSAERTRLARDLHDAVTQTLFSATLIADVLPDIWRINESEGRRRLAELRQLTRGALAEMRTLLVELRPNALIEVPLPTLLRQLSEALTGRARIDIQFSSEGERTLPPDVQVAFYRIAQEALNNVVKHSKATQAALLLRLGEQVRLSVTDNGAGFDPSGVTADHLGLKIMRERSDAIGAKFSLYSEPGEGTQVTITWQDKETK